MRILVTGAGGQLGRALLAAIPTEVTARAASHTDLDIADARAVEAVVRAFQPDVVINAAGFTRVDDAESQREEAERANARGPGMLAAACRRASAWLLQVSTDYVFDGEQSHPYAADARPNPLCVYGQTKLAGELAVSSELPSQSTVVRTSWLYAAWGHNFLTTMLRLMKERPGLTVVSDQIGAPTSVAGLARVLWAFARQRAPGTYHWCDSGVASWYDFAVAIAEEAAGMGMLTSSPEIVPISSAQYSTAARRPAFSLLEKRDTEQLLGVQALHWRTALRDTLRDIRTGAAT